MLSVVRGETLVLNYSLISGVIVNHHDCYKTPRSSDIFKCRIISMINKPLFEGK